VRLQQTAFKRLSSKLALVSLTDPTSAFSFCQSFQMRVKPPNNPMPSHGHGRPSSDCNLNSQISWLNHFHRRHLLPVAFTVFAGLDTIF
jgi:hypothetical protein